MPVNFVRLTGTAFHDVLYLFFSSKGCVLGVFMHDIRVKAELLVFHNDNDTPVGFVRHLLIEVFSLTEKDAIAFTAQIDRLGQYAAGPYPLSVAKALLEETQQRIRTAGFPLKVTSEPDSDDFEEMSENETFHWACDALAWHFAGLAQSQLVTTTRQFPGHMRADLQVAIDRLFASPVRFYGLHEEHRYETITLPR
jgi:ATP-dependent Clp protease adapter protein ClpS